MSTTDRQNNEFASLMTSHADAKVSVSVSGSALGTAMDFMYQNFSPGEIFPENDLIDWAREREPEAIFDKQTLEAWAEANGYIKE